MYIYVERIKFENKKLVLKIIFPMKLAYIYIYKSGQNPLHLIQQVRDLPAKPGRD